MIWPTLSQGEYKLGFVDAGGIRTRYLEAGDTSSDTAIVFLHGTGGHLEAFTRNIHAHADHYRTISLDMIGHGFTDKPDHHYEIHHYVRHLHDFFEAVGVKRIHLHGESMGGWIAAQYALDHPDQLVSLTLNTCGGLNTDPKVMKRVTDVTMNAVANASPETVRARLEWLMNSPERVTDDLLQQRLAIYTQPGFVKAIENILCLQIMDIRLRNVLTDESLMGIKCPTLVVWTSHDPTAPLTTAHRFCNAIPDCELYVVEDSAHWPQWEKPEEFNTMHLEFLAKHKG